MAKMPDEQEEVDERHLLTDEEQKALDSILGKLRNARDVTNRYVDLRESISAQRKQEVDIQHALFDAGPQYDYRPYMRQRPMVEDIQQLVAERNEALAQYERVKTLVQLAVGSEPGENILKLVADLKQQIEELNIERHELTAAVDFASGTEHEKAMEGARLLKALRDELDKHWGVGNLVDINVEDEGDYVFVLQRLVELAREQKG